MRLPSWLHSTPCDTPSWSLFLLNFHACVFVLVGLKIIIIIKHQFHSDSNMQSNSRAPTFEINGRGKNGPSEKVSLQLVLEILQRDRWSTTLPGDCKLVFECGTWRSPCAACKVFVNSSISRFAFVHSIVAFVCCILYSIFVFES